MRRPLLADTLKRIVPRIGATLLLEPEYEFVGMIAFANGRRTYFRENKFDLNTAGAVRIAQDKGYASFFLRHHGFSVPEEVAFYRESLARHLPSPRTLRDALNFADRVGYPVILKPNDLSQGRLVAKVHDARELTEAARRIFDRSRVALAQKICSGRDYRVVVLDGRTISAYQRLPLQVIGDGSSSVYSLCSQRQALFKESGRDTVIDFNDTRLENALARQGLVWASIPGIGQVVPLMDVANLSTGGEALDVTGSIHGDWQALCARVAEAMCLRLCGVDLICDDITGPLGAHVVLEVNSAPGLDNYQFEDPLRQQTFVDDLYLTVLGAIERGP